MGTNGAPLLALVFLNEAEIINRLIKQGDIYIASSFNFTFRNINMCCSNKRFSDLRYVILSEELEIKETTDSSVWAACPGLCLQHQMSVVYQTV